MPKRIHDTNILIDHFKRLNPLSDKGPADAEAWARILIKDKGTDAIVSPIAVEVLAGVRDSHELTLTEAYLAVFNLIDGGVTRVDHWEEAKRIAKRVLKYDREIPRAKRQRPRQDKPKTGSRDLGDCLITAIANQNGYEVLTNDKGLMRQSGRTSKS